MRLLLKVLLSGLLLIMLIFSGVCLGQVPEAFGMIIIQEDGSLSCSNADPSAIPIKRDGEVYILTGNINCYGPGISIGRSGITLDGAGYVLQGGSVQSGDSASGISFASNVGGVTVKNLKIMGFATGLSLNGNSLNNFEGNDVSGNLYNGFYFSSACHNNTINENRISDNPRWGIIMVGGEPPYGGPSTDNRVYGNTIENNGWVKSTIPNYGMENDYGAGVWLWEAVDNVFYGNRFLDNAQQVYVFDHEANVWSAGLPSGGNYWSDYNGSDGNGDGIGDSPYLIDTANSDAHPLIAKPSTKPSPTFTPYQTEDVTEQAQFPFELVFMIVGAVAGVLIFSVVFFKRKRS